MDQNQIRKSPSRLQFRHPNRGEPSNPNTTVRESEDEGYVTVANFQQVVLTPSEIIEDYAPKVIPCLQYKNLRKGLYDKKDKDVVFVFDMRNRGMCVVCSGVEKEAVKFGKNTLLKFTDNKLYVMVEPRSGFRLILGPDAKKDLEWCTRSSEVQVFGLSPEIISSKDPPTTSSTSHHLCPSRKLLVGESTDGSGTGGLDGRRDELPATENGLNMNRSADQYPSTSSSSSNRQGRQNRNETDVSKGFCLIAQHENGESVQMNMTKNSSCSLEKKTVEQSSQTNALIKDIIEDEKLATEVLTELLKHYRFVDGKVEKMNTLEIEQRVDSTEKQKNSNGSAPTPPTLPQVAHDYRPVPTVSTSSSSSAPTTKKRSSKNGAAPVWLQNELLHDDSRKLQNDSRSSRKAPECLKPRKPSKKQTEKSSSDVRQIVRSTSSEEEDEDYFIPSRRQKKYPVATPADVSRLKSDLFSFVYRSIVVHQSYTFLAPTIFTSFTSTYKNPVNTENVSITYFKENVLTVIESLDVPMYEKIGLAKALAIPMENDYLDLGDMPRKNCSALVPRKAFRVRNIDCEVSPATKQHLLERIFKARQMPTATDLIGSTFWRKIKKENIDLERYSPSEVRDIFFCHVLPEIIKFQSGNEWTICIRRRLMIVHLFGYKATPGFVNWVWENYKIALYLDANDQIQFIEYWPNGSGRDKEDEEAEEPALYYIKLEFDIGRAADDNEQEDGAAEEANEGGADALAVDGSKRFLYSSLENISMVRHAIEKLQETKFRLFPKTDAFWQEFTMKMEESARRVGRAVFPTPKSARDHFLRSILPPNMLEQVHVLPEERRELLSQIERQECLPMKKRRANNAGGLPAKRAKH